MKSIKRFFSIAALAAAVATMVGCAKEEANNTDGLTFTTTVELPADDGKAIDATGAKTFAVGDRLKLVNYDHYIQCTSQPLTTADISADGKAARFTFTFASAPTFSEGDQIHFSYPGAYPGNLTSQYGDLTRLSSYYDYAECDEVVTTEGQLPSNIVLENKYTILKLKIENGAGTDITSGVDNLTVRIHGQYIVEDPGVNEFVDDEYLDIEVSRGAGPHAAGPIYVVVPPIANGTIEFTTSINGTYYSCTRTKNVTGRTLNKGSLYPVELEMGPATVTWRPGIADGSAGVSYGAIDAHTYEYTGASLGGIILRTTTNAQWTGGHISDGGNGGSILFSSEYGNITNIVMSGFTMNSGDLNSGWTQSGTTFTWTQDPLLEPTNMVYLVAGNSLSLTAGASAQIVFTVE